MTSACGNPVVNLRSIVITRESKIGERTNLAAVDETIPGTLEDGQRIVIPRTGVR